MTWVSDLIKEITISRYVSLAILAATTVLLYPELLDSDCIENWPVQWLLLIKATFYFSFFYNLLWIAVQIAKFVKKSLYEIICEIRSHLLSEEEEDFLVTLALIKDGYINLDRINYEKLEKNKLEITGIYEKLESKDLVRITDLNAHLAIITPRGKRIARKLRAKVKVNNADSR